MNGPVSVVGAGRAKPGDVLASTGAAIRAALTDADARVSDIGGLLVCGVDAASVTDLFAFELCWRTVVADHDAVGASVVQAVDAVSAGRVGAVVCVEVLAAPDSTPTAPGFGRTETVGGWASWHAPYGVFDATVDVALDTRAYIERVGLTRAELARIPLVAAANAGRDLSLRDYLSAPMLAEPLCVHDRARPAGGAAAIVLASTARAGSRGVVIASGGAAYAVSALPEREAERPAVRAAAPVRAELGADAPGALLIGDEFSFSVVTWLEALGMCEPGRAGTVLATVDTLTRGGRLPVNPHGGHLGLGRRPDLDLAVEAVRQLRGEAGDRQVAGPPPTTVVALGGLGGAGCLLLRRCS